MIPPKTSSFLTLTFLVPEYTGEMPVFDPGDVVELEEDTIPNTSPPIDSDQ
jgi:hypothetical protein